MDYTGGVIQVFNSTNVSYSIASGYNCSSGTCPTSTVIPLATPTPTPTITQTVLVYYSTNIAGQRIEILDCDEITQCQNINPGGGIATFTDVVIRCGCYWSINGYDGTC